MEYKTVKTNFLVSEFKEEENWLNLMHSQGWKLIGITRNRYHFEKCPPEDWVYQLDFQNKNTAMSEYINLFADYGWQFILHHSNWFYFRKKADSNDTNCDIFSDSDSKIAMCEKVLSGKLAINSSLFVISCIIVFLSVFTNVFSNESTILIPIFTWLNDFLKAALPWIGAGLMVATSYSFSDYRKIRNMINMMKNPLE